MRYSDYKSARLEECELKKKAGSPYSYKSDAAIQSVVIVVCSCMLYSK